MPIKVKIPKGKRNRFGLDSPVVLATIATLIICFVAFLGVFAFYYVKYQKIIDQRMSGPVFANSSKIYAAPRELKVGDKFSKEQVAAELRHAGYTDDADTNASRLGTYRLVNKGIEVKPGPESFHAAEGALVQIKEGAIDKIASLGNGESLGAYELEPQLITGLFDDQSRSKRRLVTYDEMPEVLVDAVIAIEDRRFFQHSGVNYFRFLQAAWVDVLKQKRAQGGSTLTMQIARGIVLNNKEKTLARKLAEMIIAIELEQRYTKKQIFEFYANEVDLGQRGSFTINGFGEAAQAYFGKDAKSLTLPEAATIAGLVQRPSYLSPFRHPERALARRNLVLNAMAETGSITRDEAENAKATPLKLTAPNVEASDAPYFVDLVKDSLLSRFSEEQLNEEGYRVYTSLDTNLQRAAAEAVESGLKEVDALVLKTRTRKVKVGKGKGAKSETKVMQGPPAQVALIALNPKTGEILALVGGRNYGFSQLNHATAKRPTGSIFKPFVYAAAVNSALEGTQPAFTAATLIDDAPATFAYEDKVYEPHNFKNEYYGLVSARFALAHSLNNATVKLAEMVGYGKVADLAHQAGISSVRATPAMALGSYDATPIEMAGAYTVFSNSGTRANPLMITSIRDGKGDVIEDFTIQKKPVLDPRVAYVMTNMMEAVINNGTAAGVRARGFTAPAAGKTGTSHDAWFAGYTSNLLCVVWVGYDDYSDLKLEGAKTAAPIWADFMKRAIKLPAYKDVKPFSPPEGVITLTLDKATSRVATATCPDDYSAAFISGTEPNETCDHSAAGAAGHGNFFQKLLGIEPKPSAPPAVSNTTQQPGTQDAVPTGQGPPAGEKKKGFFGKIFGAIKGDDKKKDQPPPQQSPPQQPPKL